jgi:hypothetical protein
MGESTQIETIKNSVLGALSMKILGGLFAFFLVLITIMPSGEATNTEKQILEKQDLLLSRLTEVETLVKTYGARIDRGEEKFFSHIEGHK